MSPIFSFLCHSCMFEFDAIQRYDSDKSTDCPRCDEENAAHRIPSLPATPRGSFGTAKRNPKDKPAEFKFDGNGQGEFEKKD